jgi:hypothetical protein
MTPTLSIPRPRLWLCLLAVWCSAYFFTGGGASQQAHYTTARALVEHQTFVLDAYPFVDVDVARANGHTFSNKPPGFPLMLVPAAAVGLLAEKAWPGRLGVARQVGAHVTQALALGVFGSVILLCLWRLFLVLGMGAASPLLAALGFLGTYLFSYSTTFFSHIGTAALASGAALLVVQATVEKRELSPTQASLLGLLLGWGVLTEYSVFFAFFPLGLWAVWRAPSHAQRALMAAGALVPVGVLLAYNNAYLGGPLEMSYGHVTTGHQVEGHRQGFFGYGPPRIAEFLELSLGSYRGLFLVAPPTLVGLVGLFRNARVDVMRGFSRLALLATLLMLVSLSGYHFWQGGSSFGPRFLVPVIPWLVLGLANIWNAGPRGQKLVWASAGLGFAFMLLGPSVCMIPHASHTPGYYNTVLFLGAKFLNGQIPAFAGDIFGESLLPPDQQPVLGLGYNLGHVLGLRGVLSVVPFVAGVAFLVHRLRRI